MPKSIKDITIEDVQDLFDSIIFLRGEEYFDSGCVKSIEPLDSSTITGVVRGSQNYSVSIVINSDGEIACECSCPCDFNCKHAAALLLEWMSAKRGYTEELREGKAQKKKSIKDILNNKSKEELVELLNEVIIKNPDLKSLVKIERKEIISKIRGLFSDFWDWNEVRDLISKLETILDGIKRNRNLWDKGLIKEMEVCSGIMIKGQESVHDEGDLGIFLEDWFLLYGEIFSYTKPNREEKKQFLKGIIDWIKDDQYGFDSSYEKALLGMCSCEEDISLIKDIFKPSGSEDDNDIDYYQQFYMELYGKLGLDEKYMEIAKGSGFSLSLIEKLISLNRLDEALAECNKCKDEDLLGSIEDKKIDILKKLGKNSELKRLLFGIIMREGDMRYALKLKKESAKSEWQEYLKKIINDSRKKGRNSFLSRLYCNENDFKNAYEHSKSMSDADYLELLAKKLGTQYPKLSCDIFRKLCFIWIKSGSGWPYKKSGKMLEAIKKLDKSGSFFDKTKAEIIKEHKKKYSLMEIIERV